MKTRHEFSRRRFSPESAARITLRACLLALIVTCIGCGETNREVFKRYEPQFAQKRQQFNQIAKTLPPSGSVKAAIVADLSPAPVYDAKSKSYNTEIVMYDQLLDPDIQSEDHSRLDLLLSGDLLTCMKWTGPNNPMSATTLDERAGDMEHTLKKALALRYLVVLRPANFVPPVAVNESTYKPGTADIEAFVVDMESIKVAGSFRFAAQSASQVEYSYKEGQSRPSQLAEFAYSSLYSDARRKLAPLLEHATGGQFVLED
jgi:hypothetical protein